VTVAALGLCRRAGAIVALNLARLVSRGSLTLYHRGAMPRSALRAALSLTGALEQAGALFALGRRRLAGQPLSNKENVNDRFD
jgi:hypothetical protein